MAESDGLNQKFSAGEQELSVFPYKPATRRNKLSCFGRRKVQTIRLGGKRRRRFFLVRIFRRGRLKSLNRKCKGLIKKLRDYYRSLSYDMIEGTASVDAFQFHQRLILETSFAVPILGFFNSFPINHNNY